MHKVTRDYEAMTKAELIAELRRRDKRLRRIHERSKRRLELLQHEIDMSNRIVDQALANLQGRSARR